MAEKKKIILVQIGMNFYKLKYFGSISQPKELIGVLEKYDVRLLKEKEE